LAHDASQRVAVSSVRVLRRTGAFRMRSVSSRSLPLLCLPMHFPDAAAAKLLESLYNLTEALERR